MFSELVMDLLERFRNMEASGHILADKLQSESALPLLLPGFTGNIDEQRQYAARSITRLWHREDRSVSVDPGLVCCRAETVDSVMDFNEAKQDFQQAVLAIRKITKGDSSRLDKLIERILQQEGRRTPELREALRSTRLEQLDLLRCYAQVRILPKNLRSISWTWDCGHSAMVKVTLEEAVAMAEALREDTRKTVMTLLARLESGERLAYRKKLPNRLRANLVWEEGEIIKRKSVTISGIVISQDATLPRYVWRENPDDLEDMPERLPRIDRAIDPEPYITALRLHRYLPRVAIQG